MKHIKKTVARKLLASFLVMTMLFGIIPLQTFATGVYDEPNDGISADADVSTGIDGANDGVYGNANTSAITGGYTDVNAYSNADNGADPEAVKAASANDGVSIAEVTDDYANNGLIGDAFEKAILNVTYEDEMDVSTIGSVTVNIIENTIISGVWNGGGVRNIIIDGGTEEAPLWIMLKDLTLQSNAPIALTPNSCVVLILEGSTTLQSSNAVNPGIRTTDATLIIGGLGELHVTGGANAAGIGGGGGANGADASTTEGSGGNGVKGGNGGVIIINSGVITSYSGSNGTGNGAGIGGGAGGVGGSAITTIPSSGKGGNGGGGGDSGTIIINAGIVTAGSTNGAGIGSGSGRIGGTGGSLIKISGINGNGGNGGNGGSCNSILINIGFVVVRSTNGAGLGSGAGGTGGNGSGSSISGTGGSGGTGGNGGDCAEIMINGGTLISNSTRGAGIGGGSGGNGGYCGGRSQGGTAGTGGRGGNGGSIVLNNENEIEATSTNGAGIGGGCGGNGGSTGNTVNGGAGGNGGSCGSLAINNGKNFEASSVYGAGIGGGSGGSGANAGNDSSPSGGRGGNGGHGGVIMIKACGSMQSRSTNGAGIGGGVGGNGGRGGNGQDASTFGQDGTSGGSGGDGGVGGAIGSVTITGGENVNVISNNGSAIGGGNGGSGGRGGDAGEGIFTSYNGGNGGKGGDGGAGNMYGGTTAYINIYNGTIYTEGRRAFGGGGGGSGGGGGAKDSGGRDGSNGTAGYNNSLIGPIIQIFGGTLEAHTTVATSNNAFGGSGVYPSYGDKGFLYYRWWDANDRDSEGAWITDGRLVTIFSSDEEKWSNSSDSNSHVKFQIDAIGDILAADVDALTWDSLRGFNTEMDNVQVELQLVKIVPGIEVGGSKYGTIGSNIVWSAEPQGIISIDTGDIIGVGQVTLTATLSRDFEDGFFLTKEFYLNVPGIPSDPEYSFDKDKHNIKVWNGAENGLTPVSGAMATIFDAESPVLDQPKATDSYGLTQTQVTNIHKLRVEKAGFQTFETCYPLSYNQIKNIFLSTDNDDDEPYVTMVLDREHYRDMRQSTTAMFYLKGEEMLDLEVAGYWGVKDGYDKPVNGQYTLFQSDGAFITSNDGHFNFAPGIVFSAFNTIWLRMESDTIKSEPIRVNVMIEPQMSEMDRQIYTLNCLPGFSPTPPDFGESKGGASDLFPDNMRLPLNLLLTLTKLTTGNDGTYTIRGVIGRGKKYIKEPSVGDPDSDYFVDDDGVKKPKYGETITEHKALWDEFRKDFEATRSKLGKPGALKTLEEKYEIFGKKMDIVPGVVDADFGAIGYFEVQFSSFGIEMNSMGGIILQGGGNAKKNFPFMIGPVPVYVEIGGGVNIFGDIELLLGYGLEGVTYEASARLGLTPYLYAEAGVGVAGVAQLGVRGDLSLTIEVTAGVGGNVIRNGARIGSKGEFEASGSVRIRLLCGIVDWSWRFAQYKYTLWDTRKSVGSQNVTPSAFSVLSAEISDDWEIVSSEIRLPSRDYNKYTTAWNGDVKPKKSTVGGNTSTGAIADTGVGVGDGTEISTDIGITYTGKNLADVANESGDSFDTLQSYVLPDTIPEILKIGDKTIMIFQTDDSERKTGDHTKLMYSVMLSNDFWSEPEPVWGDEYRTPDFLFQTLSTGDDLYVIWQKSKTALTDDDSVTQTYGDSITPTYGDGVTQTYGDSITPTYDDGVTPADEVGIILTHDDDIQDSIQETTTPDNGLAFLLENTGDPIIEYDPAAMELLNKALTNMDISFAKWDNENNRFINQEFLTDSNLFKSNPVLATDGNKVTALWTEVLDGDPLGNYLIGQSEDLLEDSFSDGNNSSGNGAGGSGLDGDISSDNSSDNSGGSGVGGNGLDGDNSSGNSSGSNAGGIYAVVSRSRTWNDGEWDAPDILLITEDYISGLAAGYVNGGLEVAYETIGLGENSDVWLRRGGVGIPISNVKETSGLSFANGAFYWMQDGELICFDPAEFGAENAFKTISFDGKPISGSYKFVDNGEKHAIVWAETNYDKVIKDPQTGLPLYNDDGTPIIDPEIVNSLIKASIFIDEKYCPPITLMSVKDELVSFDAALANDNSWQFVMNTCVETANSYEIDSQTGSSDSTVLTDLTEDTIHSVNYAHVYQKTDIALEHILVDSSEMNGGVQPIKLVASNLGETRITGLDVTLGEQGIEHIVLTEGLIPGETTIISDKSLDVDMKLLSSDGILNVTATCADDINSANNEQTIALGLVDAALDVSQHLVNGKSIVMVEISNNSSIPTDLILYVYEANVESWKDDNENWNYRASHDEGNPLYARELSLDNQKKLMLNLNPDELKKDVKMLKIIAVTDKLDMNEFNNEALLSVCRVDMNEVWSEPDPKMEFQWISATGIEIVGGDRRFEIGRENDVFETYSNIEARVLADGDSEATNQGVNWFVTCPYFDWEAEPATNSAACKELCNNSCAEVLHIDSEGNITLLGSGKVKIAAISKDGGYRAEVMITVTEADPMLIIDNSSKSIGGYVRINGDKTNNDKIYVKAGEILDLEAATFRNYEFSHWESSSGSQGFDDEDSGSTTFTMPDKDVIITPVFKIGAAYQYMVVFMNINGKALKTEVVEHGKSATAPDVPKRNGYLFVGWDSDFSNIHSNEIITAQWLKLFNITVSEGVVELTANIRATEGIPAASNVQVILAVYNDDGRLLVVKTANIDKIEADETSIVTIRNELPVGAKKIKAFLWDSNFAPLITAEEYILE